MIAEAGILFSDASATWAEGEKDLVAQDIIALANKISNYNNPTGLTALNRMIPGNVNLFRVATSPRGVSAHVGAGRLQPPLAAADPTSPGNDVAFFYDNFFGAGGANQSADFVRGQSVHELAHIIDFNAGVNYSFDVLNNGRDPNYEAGNYARTNLYEYYAEVVGLWVYGAPYANTIRADIPLPNVTSDVLQRQLGRP